MKKIGNVKVGSTAIDGSTLIDAGSPVLKTRSKMADSGCVSITLVVDRDNDLMAQPIVTAPGLLSSDTDTDLLTALVEGVEDMMESMGSGRRGSDKPLPASVRNFIRKFIKRELDKNPVIEIHIVRV
ncbi:MAG: hypothetical protein D3925_01210 [Candidatus Electrothrix sp. AR5]|nr:hypothetical protein [Candidatus Electrothrix sp. AR5]